MRVTTGSRLKELMSERGLRQVDILNMSKPYQKELNISLNKSHLSQYVNDKSSPDQNKLYLLAKTLNVNEAWLMGFTNVPKERQKEKKIDEGNKKIIAIYDQLTPIQQQKVLHYAKQQLDEKNLITKEENETYTLRKRSSAAGSAIYMDDDEYNYEVVSNSVVPKGADELVEITGDSMKPLIQKGDEVYIRHQPTVENGEVAIVRIYDEGVTCKRVYYDNGRITLKSENPKFNDMHFNTNQVTILGKVIL